MEASCKVSFVPELDCLEELCKLRLHLSSDVAHLHAILGFDRLVVLVAFLNHLLQLYLLFFVE